jgi:hypothetical protein
LVPTITARTETTPRSTSVVTSIASRSSGVAATMRAMAFLVRTCHDTSRSARSSGT